jgi:hypothetical protein
MRYVRVGLALLVALVPVLAQEKTEGPPTTKPKRPIRRRWTSYTSANPNGLWKHSRKPTTRMAAIAFPAKSS